MMAVSVASSVKDSWVTKAVAMARAVWLVGPVWPVGSLTALAASQCNSVKLMD